MRCGLLGEKLGHSFSPMIHAELADYSYELTELSPEKLESFVRGRTLDAYNVTVPYKKAVMPFLDVISPRAEAIGAVNTVFCKNGKLCGDNTDYFGFCHMLDVSGTDVTDKKALVFGTGGASATVCAVLRNRGVRELVTVSHRDNSAEWLKAHGDAKIIVNTTPVGMYPHNGVSPVDLSLFPVCEGVLDVIYNPARTQLLLDAEERGIKSVNGLPMLVAQAVKAFELFTGETAGAGECERITRLIDAKTKNIILIGMPGCGKSTVGKLIADKLGKAFHDADSVFTAVYERAPSDVIKEHGEAEFRAMEHRITEELGKLSGAVIACGGGVVTRADNYGPLHQNGTVVFIERELDRLATVGRPLSQAVPLQTLYTQRIDAYRRFADITVKSTEVPAKTAELIIKEVFS